MPDHDRSIDDESVLDAVETGPGLTENPDPQETGPDRARPTHLRWTSIALVFLGGMIGTAFRELLSLRFPAIDSVAYTIGAINIAGAFLLGVLLESLARRGPDEGRRQGIRLLVGTGVMGGFTTYSTFAVDTAELFGDGRAGVGALYGLITVVAGGPATLAGLALAVAWHGRTSAGAR